MIDYHVRLGGFWYWVIIKFCQTELSAEQTVDNKRRNLIFLGILNIIFAFFIGSILIYNVLF